MATIHFIILAAFVSTSLGQIQFPGSCPDVSVVDPFEASKYLGKWYEIESYFQVYSANAICTAANYSDLGNGTIGVYNTNYNGKTGAFQSITGTARLVNGTEAKLGVTFPVSAGEAPYWVLKTDYNSYSVVFACRDFGTVNFQTVWVLCREQNPSSDLRQEIRDFLANIGISTVQLNETRQTDCPDESH